MALQVLKHSLCDVIGLASNSGHATASGWLEGERNMRESVKMEPLFLFGNSFPNGRHNSQEVGHVCGFVASL